MPRDISRGCESRLTRGRTLKTCDMLAQPHKACGISHRRHCRFSVYAHDFTNQNGLIPKNPTDKKFPMPRDGHTEYRVICHKLTGKSSPYVASATETGYRCPARPPPTATRHFTHLLVILIAPAGSSVTCSEMSITFEFEV